MLSDIFCILKRFESRHYSVCIRTIESSRVKDYSGHLGGNTKLCSRPLGLIGMYIGLIGFIAFQSKGYYWFGVIHPIELNRESWGSNRVANSFVIPPRWTLIPYTGTLYWVLFSFAWRPAIHARRTNWNDDVMTFLSIYLKPLWIHPRLFPIRRKNWFLKGSLKFRPNAFALLGLVWHSVESHKLN